MKPWASRKPSTLVHLVPARFPAHAQTAPALPGVPHGFIGLLVILDIVGPPAPKFPVEPGVVFPSRGAGLRSAHVDQPRFHGSARDVGGRSRGRAYRPVARPCRTLRHHDISSHVTDIGPLPV